jgi:hypothetical protein
MKAGSKQKRIKSKEDISTKSSLESGRCDKDERENFSAAFE